MYQPIRLAIVLWTTALLGSTFLLAGCGSEPPADEDKPSKPAAEETAAADHSGWWCVEHGVPEKECTLCSADAAEKFKAKGDWCEKHNRAESQCFICDPSRAEKFVALYEAKYGKKPPKPGE